MGVYSKFFTQLLSAKVKSDLGINEPVLSKREKLRQTAEADFQARKAKKQAPDDDDDERLMSPEERFLAGKLRLTYGTDFHSTNPSKPAVSALWYEPKAQELYVTFFDAGKTGPTYKYFGVSESEARDMYRAQSKGEAVWDILRTRGTRRGHKKSYARV